MSPSARPQPKRMTHEQMVAASKAIYDEMRAQHEAQMANGPSVGGSREKGEAMYDDMKAQGQAQLDAGPSVSGRDDSGRPLPEWLRDYMGR